MISDYARELRASDEAVAKMKEANMPGTNAEIVARFVLLSVGFIPRSYAAHHSQFLLARALAHATLTERRLAELRTGRPEASVSDQLRKFSDLIENEDNPPSLDILRAEGRKLIGAVNRVLESLLFSEGLAKAADKASARSGTTDETVEATTGAADNVHEASTDEPPPAEVMDAMDAVVRAYNLAMDALQRHDDEKAGAIAMQLGGILDRVRAARRANN